jgi:hypothetical protein
MRDVNYGWLIRYAHANGASFFFLCVYIHIARGLYYGSFNKPRVELWSVGVTIFIVMMAYNLGLINIKFNNDYDFLLSLSALIPFNMPKTKALSRIGPHDFNLLTIINCGMLGDWWAYISKSINNSQSDHGALANKGGNISVRFHLEQGINNKAYIFHVNSLFYKLGYTSSPTPKIYKKSESKIDKRTNKDEIRMNYRLSLFTFSSL